MYHTLPTITECDNSEGTDTSVMAVKCNNMYSDRRMEKNKPYSDCKREKESMFLKCNSRESFELKMQNKSTDPNKPLTTSKAPHCDEFTTKLDYLMEKVVELAKSSGDVLVKDDTVSQGQPSNTEKSKMTASSKNIYSKNFRNEKFTENSDENRKFEEFFPTCKQYSNVSYCGLNHTYKLANTNPLDNDEIQVPKSDPCYLNYRMSFKNGSLTKPNLPPILNNTIKYIRVSSNELSKTKYNIGSLEKNLNPTLSEKQTSISGLPRRHEKSCDRLGSHLSHEAVCESLKYNSYIKPFDLKNQADHETFRILISGHLKKDTPVFIIHKNDIGSSTLIKDSLDYSAYKKQGNVDILITGKFFQDNILIENEKGNPFAFDLKSHRLLIDQKSVVTQDSFIQIFNLGSFDAILEGEFVSNSETFQYIPVLSLEIVKHKLSVKNSATTIFETDEKNVVDSAKDETEEPMTDEQVCTQEQKHILHASGSQEINLNEDKKQKKINNKPNTSKFTKLKESILSFFRNKGNNSIESQNTQSSLITSDTRNTNKKLKCLMTMEETKIDRKLKQIAIHKNWEVNSTSDSISNSKKVQAEDKTVEKRNMKKRKCHQSKIVENPGVTQMQGFFLQT